MELSPFIARQIPYHVRRDYPLFVTFLTHYYEYLEQNNYPADIISKFQTLRDIQVNPDYMVDIASEIFHALPGKTRADKTNLLFRSQDFFRSKGSENALKFIYRVVFGTDVTVSYPGDDILIASEGRWKAWDAVEVLGDATSETSLTQATTGATADVVDVTFVTDRITSLPVSDWESASLSNASEVSGTWIIWTNTSTTMTIVVQQSGSPMGNIDTTLYSAFRPLLELYGGSAPTVSVYDTDTSGYVAVAPDATGYYDISDITGPITAIRFQTNENMLAFKGISLLHAPLSILEVTGVSGTFNATNTINGFTPLSALVEKDGYLDRKHLISETAKLYDGNVVSEYSYLIDGVSRKDVRENGPVLRTLVHPAGFAGFYHFEDNYLANVPAHFSMAEAGSYTYGPFDLTDPTDELTLSWTDNTAETVTITVNFYDEGSPALISSHAFTSGGTVTPPAGALTMDVTISYPSSGSPVETLTFTNLLLYHTIYAGVLGDDWHIEV